MPDFTKCICCRQEALRPFPHSPFSWCTFCGSIQGIVQDVLQVEIPDGVVETMSTEQHERFKGNHSEDPIDIFRDMVQFVDVMWVLGEDDRHFKGVVPGRKEEFDIELFRQDDYEDSGEAFWQWCVIHETDTTPHICSVQGVAHKLDNARTIASKMVYAMLKAPLDHPEDVKRPGHRTRCSVCGEPQFDTFHGMTCKNGHGGDPGVPDA